MKHLKELTQDEYNKLKKAGMLTILYPEATGDYEKGSNIPQSYSLSFKNGEWIRIGSSISRCDQDMFLTYPKTLICRRATPSEIESHLIEEAKRRGYKKGVIVDENKYEISDNNFKYDDFLDGLYVKINNERLLPIYLNGVWVEIIKDEAIKIGGYEVEFKKGEIKIGCKTISNSYIYNLFKLRGLLKALDIEHIFIEPKYVRVFGEMARIDVNIQNSELDKIIDKLID